MSLLLVLSCLEGISIALIVMHWRERTFTFMFWYWIFIALIIGIALIRHIIMPWSSK